MSKPRKALLLRLLLQVLCLVGLGMSAWLTALKLTGRIDTLAGCGAGSGCAQVLGSRWSMVLGVIPVSVPAMAVYLAVSLGLWYRGLDGPKMRMFLAALLGGAALWFGMLQVVATGFCPYCLAIHVTGVLVAIGILVLDQPSWQGRWKDALGPAMLGLSGVLLLALVQFFGPAPPTHRLEALEPPTPEAAPGPGREAQSSSPDAIPRNPHASGTGRLVPFMGGQKEFRVGSVPLVGNPDARHIFAKYFDYTCDSCRTVHGQLTELLAAHPDDYAVMMIPVPLDRACNPQLPPGLLNHDDACEIARCALAVWRHAPEAFPEMHNRLFTPGITLAEAQAEAGRHMDPALLEDPETVRWLDAFIRQDIEDFGRMVQRTPVMPKVLIYDTKILQGAPRDANALRETLRQALP